MRVFIKAGSTLLFDLNIYRDKTIMHVHIMDLVLICFGIHVFTLLFADAETKKGQRNAAKRLVLHSESDLVEKLVSLEEKLSIQGDMIQNLTQSLQQKELDIQKLQQKEGIMKYSTSCIFIDKSSLSEIEGHFLRI